jgi:SHS2 domain-containing protein
VPYRWLEHTGELRLEIEAPDEAGVFSEALAALGELIGEEGEDDDGRGEQEVRPIAVDGRDLATLLAECLTEALFLAETEDLVPLGLDAVHLRAGRLEAKLIGRHGRPTPLVKAVTYHDLRFEQSGSTWRANVVLDV